MATSQQLFVDQFVQLINANPNLTTRVIASSPSPGLLKVTTRGTDAPVIHYVAGASSVTGAGTFVAQPATGSPQYAQLYFSWTLAPGDTVKLNIQVGAFSVDLTYNQPPGTTVDPGGFDHTTVGGGGGGGGGGAGGVAIGGGGIGSAMNRRLVVAECGSASTSFGALFALDPQDATGVPIPTFRVVPALPASGTLKGEAVYVTGTRQGYAWDGTAWRDITASPIRSFASDAALQADTTEPVGAYAVASDTGNMYVNTPDGWRRIGKSEFATYADMLSHDAPTGSEAICNDLDVVFLRVTENGAREWRPISMMAKPQAFILATPNIEGLQAVATDTASTYINDGTRWIEDPIEHHPTEAALLASIAVEGHLAWSDDTGQAFVGVKVGGVSQWRRLKGPNVAVGATQPTGNAAGDLWLRPGAGTAAQNHLEVYDGAAWQSATPAQPIGTVIQSMLTAAQFDASLGPIEAAKWAMADGRSVAGSKYAQITGSNTVPDLRGAFLRMAGQNASNAAWSGGNADSFYEDTTRRPRTTDFTTDYQGNHTHSMTIPFRRADVNASWQGNGEMLVRYSATSVGTAYNQNQDTNSTGNHQHTITGGGDTETAPKHYSLNYFIRIN